jgi:hypothetical protein
VEKVDKELEVAREAKRKALALYGEWDAVNGVGLTFVDGRYAVKVNLLEALSGEQEVEKEIDGVPIVCAVVGEIRKQ